jgi:hypothetical protein
MLTFQNLEPDNGNCKHDLDSEKALPVPGQPAALQCKICGRMVVKMVGSNGQLTGLTQIAKFA